MEMQMGGVETYNPIIERMDALAIQQRRIAYAQMNFMALASRNVGAAISMNAMVPGGASMGGHRI